MNKYDKSHLAHLTRYDREIAKLYNELAVLASTIGASVTDIKDGLFSFDQYPELKARLDKLMKKYTEGVQNIVVNGVNSEWTLANNKNNALSRMVFGDMVGKLTQAQYRRYFNPNDEARKAFLARAENGLTLSDRVWRYADGFKREIELGLDVGIRNGMPATQMASELKQWLRQPDKLFRRVRDEHGDLNLSKNAKDYHPGQGIYRSSYQNARRLAVTETNMAYRESDFQRWKNETFVVGIRITLSNNHTTKTSKGDVVELHDICDELQGDYPKDFNFTGWHPHCRCTAVPILKTDEEQAKENRDILAGKTPDNNSVNKVTKLPDNFNNWVTENSDRIKNAESLPYYIKDNQQYFDLKGDVVKTIEPEPMAKVVEMPKTNEITAEQWGKENGVNVGSIKSAILQYSNTNYKADRTAYEMGFNGEAQGLVERLANGDYGTASLIARQAVKLPGWSTYGARFSDKQAYVMAKTAFENKLIETNGIHGAGIFRDVTKEAQELDARQRSARHARNERRQERNNLVAQSNGLRSITSGERIAKGTKIYDKNGYEYIFESRSTSGLIVVTDQNGKTTRIHKSKLYLK